MEVKTKGKGLNSDNNGVRLGGNIILTGFSLEPAEMIVVKKIVGTYVRKISEKIDYKEIKINLKQSQKAKSFLHEIQVDVRTNKGLLTSNTNDRNLYTALSEALNKVNNQAEHKS